MLLVLSHPCRIRKRLISLIIFATFFWNHVICALWVQRACEWCKDFCFTKSSFLIWLAGVNVSEEWCHRINEWCQSTITLNLSFSMKIHDIFYISLLRKVAIDFFIEQISSSSFSIVMKDEKNEYKINDILNSWYHYEKLQYKVAWTDHSSDRVWYFAENFQNHSKDILNDYHQKYSDKSESDLRLIASIALMTNHFYWMQ
jgi:hypothetical protein